MSDPSLPPIPNDPDELASALLDGALSPEEAARARTDPVVMARVEVLAQLRTQIRDVTPPPPNHRDGSVAAALAAADAEAPASPPYLQPVSPEQVPTFGGTAAIPIDTARSWRSNHRWLAAAAAIVVVALVAVGVLARSNDDESTDETAGQASDATTTLDEDVFNDDGGGGAGDDAEAGSADRGAEESTTRTPTAAGFDVVDLGDVSRDEIVPAVNAAMADGLGALPAEELADEVELDNTSCAGLSVEGDPTRGEPRFVGDANLDGTQVRIHVYYDSSADQSTLVATDDACNDVIDRSIVR